MEYKLIHCTVAICKNYVNCSGENGAGRAKKSSVSEGIEPSASRLTAARSDQLSYDTYQLALEENDTLTVAVKKTKRYVVSQRVWVFTLGFTYL